MEVRTPGEEEEYRKYLIRRMQKRKRRRRVIIARIIVAAAAVLIVALIVFGISRIVKHVSGRTQDLVEEEAEPTPTPFEPEVPAGYEDVYAELYLLRDTYPQVDDILLNLAGYPEDLLNMIIADTDTIDFVSDYLMHAGDEAANGVIEPQDIQDGKVPHFLQWDKRWGYVTYGDNLLAINGCGPTCMSMVYTALSGDLSRSPADIADFCIENNYYSDESGTSWSLMLEGAQKLGLSAEKLSGSEETMRDRLDNGCLLICSMGPGDFTQTGHFIVIEKITDKGKAVIRDPNSITRTEKKWPIETICEQMKAVWAYSYTDTGTAE